MSTKTTKKRTKEVSSRRKGIDACLEWLSMLQDAPTTATPADLCIIFEPDQSGDHDGIGVYAKTVIAKGDTILSFPMPAALTLDHERFSGPTTTQFVNECRQSLETLIDKEAAAIPPYDRYAKLKGRVLLKNYLLLSFLVTLMWQEEEEGNQSLLQQEMAQARDFWSCMMATEPHDWSHVPLLWSVNDLEMIRGTSFHALTVRMQQEMDQVFRQVFLPTISKFYEAAIDSESLHSKFKLALAFVYSHTHSKQQGQDEAMKLAANGFLQLNLNDDRHGSNKPFVEPIPICFPIVDLINGTRRTKDSNGELIATASSYQVVATRDIAEGEELFLCYGEDTLNNLDFFVKFGYIPLLNGCPVLVKDDFVTLPLGAQLRPQVVEDPKIKSISKLDQLRWTELEKNHIAKNRLVEPVPYFQRPFYLNGHLDSARRLRNSSAFSQTGVVSIPQIDKMEQYVMTMLANKQALKKLSEGKMPPPPMLEGWEPGQRIIQILDYYLEEHTTLSETTTEQDLEASKSQTQLLATHARIVEREILLIWRHAIASHHALYQAEKAQVQRLPKGNKACCVQCRTSLNVQACPKCGSVYYCSDACRNYDWDQGQHSRLCALFAAKNKK